MFLVFVGPVAVAVLQLAHLGDRHIAAADYSIIELGVRNAARGHQLVGPYSRFGLEYGWSHPGPLMFYAVLPAYLAAGQRFNGIALGIALVNVGWIGAVVALARRCWSRGEEIGVLIGLLVFEAAYGLEHLRDPWNPYVTVLSGGAALFAVASIFRQPKLTVLPVLIAIGSGSFAVQSHLGAAPVAGAAIAVALIHVFAGGKHRDLPGGARRLVLGAVALAAVCWFPVLIEQIVVSPGNVGLLVQFLRIAPPGGHGWLSTLHPMMFTIDPVRSNIGALLGAGSPYRPLSRVRVVDVAAVAALVAAFVGMSVRADQRQRGGRWLVALFVAGMVALAASLQRSTGELYPYLALPGAALGMFLLTTTGALVAGHRRWSHRPLLAGRSSAPFMAGVGFALATITILIAMSLGRAAASAARPITSIHHRAELDPLYDAAAVFCGREGGVLVDGGDGRWIEVMGLALSLDRCRTTVSLGDSLAFFVDPFAQEQARRPAPVRLFIGVTPPPGRVHVLATADQSTLWQIDE